MKFEDKIQLAVEMTRIRLEADKDTNGTSRIYREDLPTVEEGGGAFSDCVRAMFNLIEEIE